MPAASIWPKCLRFRESTLFHGLLFGWEPSPWISMSRRNRAGNYRHIRHGFQLMITRITRLVTPKKIPNMCRPIPFAIPFSGGVNDERFGGHFGRKLSKWLELSDRRCYWLPNTTVCKARLAIPAFRMFLKSEFSRAVWAKHNGSCVSSVFSWEMEFQRRPSWQYSALCPCVRKWPVGDRLRTTEDSARTMLRSPWRPTAR